MGSVTNVVVRVREPSVQVVEKKNRTVVVWLADGPWVAQSDR